MDWNFITAVCYALATCLAWMGAETSARRFASPVLWGALAAHAIALSVSMFGAPGGGVNLGFSHAVSLIAWLTALTYVGLGRDARLNRLASQYLAPSAAVACVLVALMPGRRMVDYGAADGFFIAHVVVALLAYALFTVATLHALLTLLLQRQLHAGSTALQRDDLPPLLKIERSMFRLLGIAFTLLTVTLLTGVLFSEALFNKPFEVTHKTVFAFMSWLVFAGLLLGHWLAGWRGKLAVRWVLIGFAMLLLSYVGSKFVLEVILKRF
jgi:ABC-type uncharacterized transport system permease subunit